MTGSIVYDIMSKNATRMTDIVSTHSLRPHIIYARYSFFKVDPMYLMGRLIMRSIFR